MLKNTDKLINVNISAAASLSQSDVGSLLYIDLIETSRIKYECLDGYQLRKTNELNNQIKIPSPRKALIEKCELNRDEMRQRSNQDSSEDESDNDDESSENNSSIVVSSSEIYQEKNKLIKNNNFYECIKPCKTLKFTTQHSRNVNGFLAPIKKAYLPGDQLTFYCNEGHAAQIPYTSFNLIKEEKDGNSTLNETQKVSLSNINSLECSLNGTWHLLLSNQKESPKTILSINEITLLPQCLNIKDILSQNNGDSLSLSGNDDDNDNEKDNIVYAELNIRSLLLMFTIGGSLMVLLILSVVALKFYRTRLLVENGLLFYRNFNLPDSASGGSNHHQITLDPSESSNTTTTHHSLNLCSNQLIIPRSAPSMTLRSSSITSLNSQLPSYEEVVSNAAPPIVSHSSNTLRPLFYPPSFAIANQIFSNHGEQEEVKPIDEGSTTSQLEPIQDLDEGGGGVEADGATGGGASASSNIGHNVRNGSIRSNSTILSANPSIRTTNSIGTSTSIGNSSQNSRSTTTRVAAQTRQNIKKTQNQRKYSQHQQQRSVASKATTTSTTTADSSSMFSNDNCLTLNSSLLTNKSDASKVALLGSTSSSLQHLGIITDQTSNFQQQEQQLRGDDFLNDDESRKLINSSSSTTSIASLDNLIDLKIKNDSQSRDNHQN